MREPTAEGKGERKQRATGGECAHLAQELRGLKERTGLSLAALAERTPYSKSSWERYLNAKKPVPRQAVEALCAVAAEPAARLLALWELADTAWSGRSAPGGERRTEGASTPADRSARPADPAAASAHVPEKKGSWRPYALITAGALAGAAVAVTVGFAVLGAGGPGGPGAGGAVGTGLSPRPTGAAVEAGCLGVRCVGRTPKGMGCGQSGAATSLVDRYARGGQRLEIRYSSVCRSVWVRASFLKVGDKVALYPALEDEGEARGGAGAGTAGSPGAGVDGGAVEAGARNGDSGMKVMRAEAVDVGDATGWVVTPMLAPRDPSGVRACLEPALGGAPECFDK
ncbi:helix-turn-helix domain-containing protein [Streptomyces sp. NPDC021093]|uniref:helix-turn-helix domain-containing protein n=1 Tax=Streptomyces sp. NPDC021093 TaxID=3365112 RepID=UPI0037A38B03